MGELAADKSFFSFVLENVARGSTTPKYVSQQTRVHCTGQWNGKDGRRG